MSPLQPSASLSTLNSSQTEQEKKAFNAITYGIILTKSVDDLRKRIMQDEEFKSNFYQAIQTPPAAEIQDITAKKIVQIILPVAYPAWTKEISSRITQRSHYQKKQEQHYLNCCTNGTTLDMSRIESGEIDPLKVRDIEGRTMLHLALLNPNFSAISLCKLLDYPGLVYVRDYEQNLPLDLLEPGILSYNVYLYRFLSNKGIQPPSTSPFQEPETSKPVASPNFQELLTYLIHLKNQEKALLLFKNTLNWFFINSVKDFECLKEPIALCIKMGKEEMALKILAAIAQKTDFPFLVIVALAYPQLLKTSIKQEYINLPTDSNIPLSVEFCYSPLVKSMNQDPLTQICGLTANRSFFSLVLNLRAILHTDPTLCDCFVEVYKKDLSAPLLFDALLCALPDNNPQAYKYVFDLIEKILSELPAAQGVEKKTTQLLCLGKLLQRIRSFYKKEKPSAELFNSLLLKHIVTNEDLSVLLSSTPRMWLFFLDNQTLNALIDKTAPTYSPIVPPTAFLEDFLNFVFTRPNYHFTYEEPLEGMTATECLSVLKTIAKYPKLSLKDVKYKQIICSKLIQMDRPGCDLLLEYLFNHFSLSDAELIEYALNATNVIGNNAFNAIIRVILARPTANEILKAICGKTIEIPNQEILRISVSEPIIRRLRQIEPVVWNEKVRIMLTEVVASSFPFVDNCAITKERLEQCLPPLQTLQKYDIPFDKIFNEDQFYRALKRGEFECCRLIFRYALKKLSLNPQRCAFLEKSQAYKIFSENYDDLLAKLGSNANPVQIPGKYCNGLVYEIKLNAKEKIVTSIRWKIEGQLVSEILFSGYITYEKLLQVIQNHELALHNLLISENIRKDYAEYIVDSNATLEAQGLNSQNKKMAIKICPAEKKILLHLLKPGEMALSIKEITFDDFRANPKILDKEIQEWNAQVDVLFLEAKEKLGANHCFLSDAQVPERLNIFVLLDKSTGQLAFFERGKGSYGNKNLIYKQFAAAYKDWINFQMLGNWAIQKGGFVIPKRTFMLSENYHHIISSLEHPWVCLPWVLNRAWLVSKDILSGMIISCPLTNLQDRDNGLKNLLEIQGCLGGHIFNKTKLNALVQPPSIRKHHEPSKAHSLNKLLVHFQKIKTQEPYQSKITKAGVPAESLESNLVHLIKVVSEQKGIVGWEDQQKHHRDYHDVLIYLTNTLEDLLKSQDDQALSMLVLELAKYGRHCGNKISEVTYQNYALTFGINLAETEADDLDSVLSLSYKQAFLETIDVLVQFIGDPEAKNQTIHVISYLRAQLAALGYAVPEDPRISPELQDGTKDRFHMKWGSKDYPKEILETVFPSICIPLFMLKFQEAQEGMLKKSQWSPLGILKQIMMGRIEMGLEETILFPIEPMVLESYKNLSTERAQKILEAKAAVEDAVKNLNQHEQNGIRCVKEVSSLESSLMTLTSKITEIGEECLSISRKRQQLEVRIKDLKIVVPAPTLNQTPLHGKRSKDQAFPGFNSEEEEAELQLNCLLRTQSIAEKSLAELQMLREVLKNILVTSGSDIAFLSKRQQLLNLLKQKKNECEDTLSNKSNINALVEEWADKEGYTKDSEPISILSLKGLTQVLIQKGLFIPCHQLQRQWAAMNELKEQRAFLTSSSHSVNLPQNEEWLQSVFADFPEVEQNEG